MIFEKLKKNFSGKRVLIVGLGLLGGGVGLAEFFSKLDAKVTVTDKKTQDQLKPSIEKLKKYPITFHLGRHQLTDFLTADIIFKGPSVSWNLPEIKAAQKKGIPVEMELSFFSSICPAKIIGVTGTRGKSTTTAMIYQLLKSFNFSVYLAGGLPQTSTISLLEKITPNDWVVIELSSWALSGFHQKKISPQIAVFTSFYPDHLNYYSTLNDYLFDKKAIYLYQKKEDFLIANKKLETIILQDKPKSKVFFYQATDFQEQFKYLAGEHNQENAAAVLTLAKILKLDLEKSKKIISQFSGLPGRQQVIAKKNKIIFINDTTSTTPTATIFALKRFSNKPIVLILGGNSKNLPFNQLVETIEKTSSIKKIILLAGSFTNEILPILKQKIPEKLSQKIYNSLSEAVKKAYLEAQKIKKEALVLFSPAATSFAMFNNEFHRGKEFEKIVNKLI
ncbi:MAG: UDP-N-acetylmuramoyl-L-alanine--D-glutamate ligase [Patescibacteria group bacterium]|nr:UDP-N-acetylmuramoyl-L-alanine--D-glutamate ligase [Patescibacteria group bacterium]